MARETAMITSEHKVRLENRLSRIQRTGWLMPWLGTRARGRGHGMSAIGRALYKDSKSAHCLAYFFSWERAGAIGGAVLAGG